MPLNKNWCIIFRFAVTGLLIATLVGVCMVSDAPNLLTNIVIIFSPGLLLFFEWIWARIPFDNSAVTMWSSVGLVAIVNGLIYAVVGTLIVGLLRMLNHKSITETAEKSEGSPSERRQPRSIP